MRKPQHLRRFWSTNDMKKKKRKQFEMKIIGFLVTTHFFFNDPPFWLCRNNYLQFFNRRYTIWFKDKKKSTGFLSNWLMFLVTWTDHVRFIINTFFIRYFHRQTLFTVFFFLCMILLYVSLSVLLMLQCFRLSCHRLCDEHIWNLNEF